MSLWVDSEFVTAADLNAEDPEVATGTDRAIDRAEGVTLSGPNGLIRRALNECASDIQRASESWGRARVGDRGADHFAILGDSLHSGERSRPRWTIEQIVVTGSRPLEITPVKSWVFDKILEALYLRAINKADGDRYMARLELRRNRIHGLTWPKLRNTGIPIVNTPFFAPGAVQVTGSGTFTADDLSVTPSAGGTLDKTLYCVVTWTSDRYQSPDDQGVEESGPSERANQAVTSGNVLRVSIANLNPPAGGNLNLGLGSPQIPTKAAAGWNVYVGVSAEDLFLQNSTPLPLTQTTYDLPGNPVSNTAPVFHGQDPDSYIQVDPQWMRA